MGKIAEDNRELYYKGEDVLFSESYFTTPGELNTLEKRLDDYSKKFGEEAVFVEWGQDYGGPSTGFKVHKKREVEEMLSRYEKEKVRGIYPKIGLVIDYALVRGMKEFIRKGKQERKNRDQEYLPQYLKLIFQGSF